MCGGIEKVRSGTKGSILHQTKKPLFLAALQAVNIRARNDLPNTNIDR